MHERWEKFENYRLNTKFSILLAVVMLGAAILVALVTWQIVQTNAETETTTRATFLIQMMRAVRGYTTAHVQPFLQERIQTASAFPAESVPAFSAHTVFDSFRRDGQYQDYTYKEASPNPTNPTDKADDFEAQIVQQMSNNGSLTQLAGYRLWNNRPFYYIAMPLTVSSPSCLVCHGDPANAPKSMLSSYGSQAGFGWKLNQVIAAQMVYVPVQDILGQILPRFAVLVGVFLLIFFLAISMINFTLRHFVIQPVAMLSGMANKIAGDQITPADLETETFKEVSTHSDELGQLAHVFKEMTAQVYQRTETLKKQVSQLNIEIDEIKKQKQVSELVDTDEFRDLLAKAQELRKQRSAQAPPATGGETSGATT
ncbi:MAG: DUF3365 domain-containing protein [Anaerolineae bacterium]